MLIYKSFMMVIILILFNTSFDAVYKHVFNTVCVVILFSSIWPFNLRPDVKTLPRYFTLRTISLDFPPVSIASCLHSRVKNCCFGFSVVYYKMPFITNYSNKLHHFFYFLICFAYQGNVIYK